MSFGPYKIAYILIFFLKNDQHKKNRFKNLKRLSTFSTLTYSPLQAVVSSERLQLF
jgi:hypothetical protein